MEIDDLMYTGLSAKEVKDILKLKHKLDTKWLEKSIEMEKKLIRFKNDEELYLIEEIKKFDKSVDGTEIR